MICYQEDGIKRKLRLVWRLASLGVSPDEIAGLSEIAAMLGVTKRTAVRYSKRDDFPAPLARLTAGFVWDRGKVEAWGKEHLPLPPGRPRKSV
jgi:predicted DNA-binding transcriptional regulator AlpA